MRLLTLLLFISYSTVIRCKDMVRLPVTRIEQDELDIGARVWYRASIFDQYDNTYVTTVEVGERREQFRIVLDTGSGHFFIPSIRCGKNCGEHRRYQCPNPSDQIVNLKYGTGRAIGTMCTDTVSMAGLTAKGQQFVVVHNIDDVLRGLQFDGILGLAYGLQANFMTSGGSISHITPVFATMAIQNRIRKAFSFYMTNFRRGNGSFVIFGGSDKNYYEGELKFVPVVPVQKYNKYILYKYWQVKMTSFMFGQRELLTGSANVLIDSGSSNIVVSNDVYDTIINIIGPYFTCEAAPFFPVITMTFGEQEFSLNGSDYVYIREDECFLKLRTKNKKKGHEFIMGDAFFRKYYIEFDFEYNKIGFAKSKHITDVKMKL